MALQYVFLCVEIYNYIFWDFLLMVKMLKTVVRHYGDVSRILL